MRLLLLYRFGLVVQSDPDYSVIEAGHAGFALSRKVTLALLGIRDKKIISCTYVAAFMVRDARWSDGRSETAFIIISAQGEPLAEPLLLPTNKL